MLVGQMDIQSVYPTTDKGDYYESQVDRRAEESVYFEVG